LPGGNEVLTPLVWQPLPGADGAAIYPLVRKLDSVSSNSYLIETQDVIILIDPGGLPEQTEQLSQLIGECRSGRDRPVFVFLTHAHVDHFIGALTVPAFAHLETAVFAVQERGGEALLRGEAEMTQAALFERLFPPLKTGMHIFPRSWESDTGIPVSRAFPNGATVTVTYGWSGVDGHELPRALLEFGDGPALEVFFTPGHSPDSICLRMGGLLFIGDLLFAANPGVAGSCGWNQESLLRSIRGMQDEILSGRITTVCPGHGRMVSAPDAARMLAGVMKEARELTGIAEMNFERADQTAAFAEDCMEQANELFTIMAGRLYYVSYVMDELGESDIAERMKGLISGDTVDEILEAFAAFADEHHRSSNVSIHLALKAAQVTARLERAFNREQLMRIIDPTLIGRAGRLLSDYTMVLRGFRPPGELSEHDLVPLVEAVVTGLSVPACSDEDLLSSADNDTAFIGILLSRIGTRPLLENVALSLDADDRSLRVSVDRDHLADLLTYILEDLVGTGSDGIGIILRRDGRQAILSVSGNASACTVEKRLSRKRSFLTTLCERAGGTLKEAGEGREFMIALELA